MSGVFRGSTVEQADVVRAIHRSCGKHRTLHSSKLETVESINTELCIIIDYVTKFSGYMTKMLTLFWFSSDVLTPACVEYNVI